MAVDVDLSDPKHRFAKCPKCYYSMVEFVDVLDVDDEYLGESRYCRQCHWLEEDEWPNIVAVWPTS